MPPQRLPATRIAGIVAWTAASVAWGTALVATANAAPDAQSMAEGMEPEPVIQLGAEDHEVLSSLPSMPESGLVVLRYTPSEKPEAQVVVRRVVVASAPGGNSAPTKVKSSGS